MPWIPILVAVGLFAWFKTQSANKLSVSGASLTGFKIINTGEFAITLMLAIKNPTSLSQTFTSIYGTAQVNDFAPIQFNNAVGETLRPNATTNVPVTITIMPGNLFQVLADVIRKPGKARMAIKSTINVGPFAIALNGKWDMEKILRGTA
jgi:LEA14-like dessication related protein